MQTVGVEAAVNNDRTCEIGDRVVVIAEAVAERKSGASGP